MKSNGLLRVTQSLGFILAFAMLAPLSSNSAVAQVVIEGDCNIIFDRVNARQVALNSCARKDQQLAEIMRLLNQIIKDEKVEIATVETFINNMNGFMARSEAASKKQTNALYYLNDRFSKLEDFLILLVQSPEDAGQVANLLIDESLSHTQSKGPLVVQVINFREYISTSDKIFMRLTLRIALKDFKGFEVGVIEDYRGNPDIDRVSGWRVMGSKGTSCFSLANSDGINIHMARNIESLKPTVLDHMVGPKTISTTLRCPFNFGEPRRDVELSFFVRPVADKTDPGADIQRGEWERIDFKFSQLEYQPIVISR